MGLVAPNRQGETMQHVTAGRRTGAGWYIFSPQAGDRYLQAWAPR